ncbi:TRAP-type mannitol/chloroaromatic compound transporter periplasmic protein [Marinobacter lipolyticus SM19]|uniref:TRAP-type mannitol/chloroaromatic compound transporter periplasmic protein n=1 Tax=Marinobacter lipolyticus SM19 TaxID=1318628 RepID=R8B4M0_9GAMM|nr:TRAP transporter substrate-binding protein [Marinobacter lipolyticus]EON93474.1 TRAP-type mannitol/chloroaromatic compound transporter periplasmic protein [Marinobacter lipolyticus SM19]
MFPTRHAVGLFLATLAFNAFAADFTFKFQSSDPAGVKNFEIQQAWADRVEAMTGGRVEIDLLPVGSIVSHTETLGAMKMGVLDGHISVTGYFSGKDPAFGLIGNTVGAWSSPDQLIDYINYGGGYELMNELYEPYGVKFVGGGGTGLESFVSKKPLDGVEDLKGLKMRAPEGLVQSVFAAAGASPVNLPGSEVYTALSKGVIDAADYTVFSTNHEAGLNDIASHPVNPGFHSLPLLEIAMGLKAWEKLPEDIQVIMTVSARDFAQDISTQLAMADREAVNEARANPEITIHDWSAEERRKFRTIARDQWKVYAEQSPNAGKVYQSVTAYLESQGLL